jgi:hypothetical protein
VIDRSGCELRVREGSIFTIEASEYKEKRGGFIPSPFLFVVFALFAPLRLRLT